MIDAIVRLGSLFQVDDQPQGLERYTELDEHARETLGALIESPGADKTLVLEFDRYPPRFRGYHLEDCRNEDPLRYLYRSGPPNGPLALPYGHLTGRLSDKERAEGKLVKAVSNRLVGWAKAIENDGESYRGSLSDAALDWLRSLAKEIQAKQDDLSSIVDDVQRSTPSKTKLFLSLAFIEGEETLPLGDPRLPFARLFIVRNRARMFEEGESHIATCSLCGSSAAVSPKFGSDVFPFATFDQPAYVAGGLDRKDAWRAFSLCSDCHQKAVQGRRYIEQHLTRKIGSGSLALSYWVVPSLFNPEPDSDAARDVIDLLVRQKNVGTVLNKAERRKLLSSENDLLDELQEMDDYLVFSLIFVEKVKARERILLCIEDVLPSRLRKLFEAKAQVEKLAHRQGILQSQWEFTLYRHLFPLCEVNRGGDKIDLRRSDFLAILDHAFRDVLLEPGYLANLFIGPLRSRFVAWQSEREDDGENEWKFRDIARAAWLTWHFLDRLGIIRDRRELDAMGVASLEQARPTGPYFAWLEDFFAESAKTFQHDGGKVAFLLGSLTDTVREVQLEHLKAAPFVKYTKSLRMEQRDLLDLLPRITQKLTEYDAYSGRTHQMLEAVSYYLARAGIGPWPYTSAEINLLFSMGMNLGFVVRRGPGKVTEGDETGEGNKQQGDIAEIPN